MRIHDKIDEIEQYISELRGFMPENLEEYMKSAKTRAACERYFEKIVEAVVDVAFQTIKDNVLKMPEEEKEAFDILASEGIITDNLAERLKDAKGMRNIIAHQYGKVDDGIVFNSITKELVNDAEEFLKSINKAAGAKNETN